MNERFSYIKFTLLLKTTHKYIYQSSLVKSNRSLDKTSQVCSYKEYKINIEVSFKGCYCCVGGNYILIKPFLITERSLVGNNLTSSSWHPSNKIAVSSENKYNFPAIWRLANLFIWTNNNRGSYVLPWNTL